MIGTDLLRYDKESVFTFLDFETENLCLNFCNNRPWQLAMIKVQGEKIIDQRDIYIKWDPPINVSPGAAIVTRFDQQKYDRLAIPADIAFETMYEWLEETDYIVGHNVLNFDVFLIKEYCLKYKKPWKHFIPKIIDTLCLSKSIKFNIPYHKDLSLLEFQYKLMNSWQKGVKTTLKAMGEHYQIEFDETRLHEALYDLGVNLKVWNKLKWGVEI